MTDQLLRARRGRMAVAAMFLANGFIIGSWAPQIPLVLSRLEISETTLGLLILIFGLGALVAMPWCGYLMSRHGSRAMLRIFAVLSSFALLLVALAGSVWAAAPMVFFLGGTIGAMDVAMNTNAVTVEKRLGRAIMSSSHGFWSLGGFFGGALGGLAIQAFGHLAHAAMVTLVTLAIVAAAYGYLSDGDKPAPSEQVRFRWPTNPLVYLVGFMALFSMIPEGAVLDWAALYLQQEMGSDIATAGFAFAAFSATMATMRFMGDGVRNRFGAVNTLRVSALIAASGMMVAGMAPDAWTAIAAFAFAGLGIANMVPIAFSAAGNQPGVASATGMSVVTTMGYSGILVAPSAIGFIGERTGFAPIFVSLAGLLVVVCLMAGLARSADFVAHQPAE
ncbi:MFS transporter [Mesorhizobium microcysteis]|uniref:MFS transporter n=1 Tax=Neoaquamicrobium microcysteis TaxID=2682781 RepID=A0A5D4H1Q1_9HYPH|nr:MFS transporter [Mesorhizobium microcysteis]TYR34548.1 MFS transporter [Mesorhizobium microcysteis]